MADQILIKDSDLVLDVSKSYDSKNFNINEYEPFLDKLCGTREYQKEAIRNTCRYLLGGKYTCLKDLALENFSKKEAIKNKFGTEDKYLKSLNFADKLACNIDLATGTGKSYVIYGIAQIMLCEGVVDRVLVLCPSVTIEEGLTEKFRQLAGDFDITRILPNKGIKTPNIQQADRTIEAGTICIENIHSTYKNTKSAIGDSLKNNGERTLVLNDESHHIYSKADKNVKVWKSFLEDEDYGFKYIVGFSGTPYIENEYFSDVVYRYSLNEGISAKFIKDIEYVTEDTIGSDNYIKMQVIYQNHMLNKKNFDKIKPITIVISKDIDHCKVDRQKIIDFLVETEGCKVEEAEEKVLIVTSDPEHKENLNTLKSVKYKNNPVEWICSVAMLTEGWDVPNVFQIVPSEEKAFNSKLLISQVLGRGLRIPNEYKGENLHVTVLNHKKFSDRINHLVDAVLEREEKIHCYPVEDKSGYDFELYNLVYNRTPKEEINQETNKPFDLSKMKNEGIDLQSEEAVGDVSVRLKSMGSGEEKDDEDYQINRKTVDIDILAKDIENKIISWDTEMKTTYADECDFKVIKDIIEKSLKKARLTEITEKNALKIRQSFGIIKRKSTKVLRYTKEPVDTVTLSTGNIKPSTVSLYTLIQNDGGYLFYDDNSEKYSNEEDKPFLKKLIDEMRGKYVNKIENSFNYKTSSNISIVKSEPEKKFIDYLTKKYPNLVDAWCKSNDKGFYEIEYGWRKGDHPKIDHFNPDFFLKIGDKIIVIEIKYDRAINTYGDDFKRNRKKYEAATKHFEELNKFLEGKGINQKYYFHFCTPNDYSNLFRSLEKDNIDVYMSNLDLVFKDSAINDEEFDKIDRFDSDEIENAFKGNWNNLEEGSRMFLLYSEKNYILNKDEGSYFSPDELIKTFELELRIKLFDRMRDDEEAALKILDVEEKNEDLIKYFNYASDRLTLGAMENALRFNNEVKNYIRENFNDSEFFIGNGDGTNYISIKNGKFEDITDAIYNELPNLISLVRLKFRNQSAHGDKITNKDEYEELRDLLIFGKGILVKLLDEICN